MIRFMLAIIVTLMAITRAASADNIAAPSHVLKRFAENYCLDCHTGEDSAAGFDFDLLASSYAGQSVDRRLATAATFQAWVNVFDRVDGREMPPADADQPDPELRAEVRQQHRHDARIGICIMRISKAVNVVKSSVAQGTLTSSTTPISNP